MYGHGIAGGVLGRGEHIREAEPDRPHVGGGSVTLAERLRQEPGAGRLAVRAGDAGDRHGLRGLAEEAVGDGSDVMGELRNGRDEHIVSAAAGKPRETRLHELERSGGRLIKHRAGATRQSLTDELRAVTPVAATCEEERAGARAPRVERHVADLERRGRGDEAGGQLREPRAV